MEDLRNKDEKIRIIWNTVSDSFGANFFGLVDFWDADNYAFGFKRGNKLIYVSTWEFRESLDEGIKCYSEFELINETSLDPQNTVKKMNGILLDNLLDEIKQFIDDAPPT